MTLKYKCPNCSCSFEWDNSALNDTLCTCPSCSHEIEEFILSFEPGYKIGDYIIKDTIGVGGMGEVFLAEQQSMKREVALKILLPSLSKNKGYLKRFFQEVRTLAKIEHPNVVKAIEAGIDEEVCYFSMMYIPGQDLKERLERGERYDELEAIKIVLEVAKALKYVWEKHKIIHRDIKPSNIIVSEEDSTVKLMDLGISKQASKNSELTVKGMMVGSPNYVSPEQARAEKDLDFRADMYSLGSTYYHLITGELPYSAENSVGVIARHIADPIPDPREVNSSISKMSKLLIDRFMAKKREGRYDNWDDAIDAIELIVLDLGGSASTTFIKKYDIPDISKDDKQSIQAGIHQEKPVEKTTANIPTKFPFTLKWHRIIALLILLLLFLAAFYSVVQKSIREQKKASAKKHYDGVMALINNAKIEHYPRLITRLEQIQRIGDPYYSNKAKETIEFLRKKVSDDKKIFQIRQRNIAYKNLFDRVSNFERKEDYGEAIKLLKYYLQNGKYKDEPMFQREIKLNLDYFVRKQKAKEAGLLPD